METKAGFKEPSAEMNPRIALEREIAFNDNLWGKTIKSEVSSGKYKNISEALKELSDFEIKQLMEMDDHFLNHYTKPIKTATDREKFTPDQQIMIALSEILEIHGDVQEIISAWQANRNPKQKS